MQVITQTLVDILASLSPLAVEWQDEVAQRVIVRLKNFPIKADYKEADIHEILEGGPFEDGMLLIRLFLGLSKDQFSAAMRSALGGGGIGVNRFRADRGRFLAALASLGLFEAISAETGRRPHWSDTLVERLRSGRGSAISGQRRGRGVEDFSRPLSAMSSVMHSRCALRLSAAWVEQLSATLRSHREIPLAS